MPKTVDPKKDPFELTAYAYSHIRAEQLKEDSFKLPLPNCLQAGRPSYNP